MSGLSTAQNIATMKKSNFLRQGLVFSYLLYELISYLLSLITVNTVTTASNNYTLNTNSHIVTNSNSNNSIINSLIDNKKSEIKDLDFDKD